MKGWRDKGVFRNFAKFTGRHLYQSLFFDKIVGGAWNLLEEEALTKEFLCEFGKIFKNTFFTEQLWATDSVTSGFRAYRATALGGVLRRDPRNWVT